MVVASTLAFLVLNGKLDKVDSGGLVDMAVKNERVIGVNSGGMDVRYHSFGFSSKSHS